MTDETKELRSIGNVGVEQSTIDLLERWLKQARAGNLRHIAGVGICRSREHLRGWSDGMDIYKTVGMLEDMKAIMLEDNRACQVCTDDPPEE